MIRKTKKGWEEQVETLRYLIERLRFSFAANDFNFAKTRHGRCKNRSHILIWNRYEHAIYMTGDGRISMAGVTNCAPPPAAIPPQPWISVPKPNA